MKPGAKPQRRVSRRRGVDPVRKATYQLRSSVLEAIRNAVNSGVAPSANVFVEQAVERELREMRRARVYQAYEEAARDADFVRETDEVMRDFDSVLSDGLED